jgi:hypothetical protein
MRVIINLASDTAAAVAGWRARVVTIDALEATATEVLRAVIFPDGSSLFDIVTDGNQLKVGWILYINGVPLKKNDFAAVRVTDNMQMHVKSDGR